MFKKIIAVLLVMATLLAFASCNGQDADNNSSQAEQSDKEYVIGKKKLVVGVTDFEPMDFKDKDGKWKGFDADLAKAFASELGVEIEFVEIVWDNKVSDLNAKVIDVVWNGMTLNDEVAAAMSCSEPYCDNAQVVVVPADKADQYKTVESIKDLTFAVEGGSAGKKEIEKLGYKFTEVEKQSDALMEVAAGTSGAAVIDSLMAAAMVGEGTAYDKLAYTVSLNSEKYVVGFRKDSDLTAELNAFLKKAYADGTVKKLAEQYGVQASIIEQK